MKRLCFFILAVHIAGCINFKSAGSDLGDGLSSQTDKIGSGLIRGVTDELTNEERRKKLETMLSELIARVGASANTQVTSIRDTLIGEYTRKWLSDIRDDLTGAPMRANVEKLLDEVLGAGTRHRLAGIRDELLGHNTRELLASIMARLREEAVGDSTAEAVARLLQTALGDKTNAALRAIVDSAATTLNARLKETGENLGFFKDYAIELLVGLGAVAIAIIGYIWWQRRKYLRLSQVLTTQIHDIPKKDEFNELTARISRKAKEQGLEPLLRDLLSKQGILGDIPRKVVTGER